MEKLPYEFLCAKFELDFVIADHTRFDFTCPRSSNTLFVGLRISRPLLGDGARPLWSIIFPLHENCREACAACAASIIAAIANPTIAALNIVFLRIDGSPQSQAVRREHGPGETSCPADDPKCRLRVTDSGVGVRQGKSAMQLP